MDKILSEVTPLDFTMATEVIIGASKWVGGGEASERTTLPILYKNTAIPHISHIYIYVYRHWYSEMWKKVIWSDKWLH